MEPNKENPEHNSAIATGGLTIDMVQSVAGSPANLEFMEKLLTELRNDLVNSFKRLAVQNDTTEEKIQLAMRFKDLPNGDGDMFYQLMIAYKPVRDVNFNRDILGAEGKEAMFHDESGKEAFVKAYVLGVPQFKIEGMFHGVATKYGVQKWSELSAIFYKKNSEDPIKLAVYVFNANKDGKNACVDKIDIFADNIKELIAPQAEGDNTPPVVENEKK